MHEPEVQATSAIKLDIYGDDELFLDPSADGMKMFIFGRLCPERASTIGDLSPLSADVLRAKLEEVIPAALIHQEVLPEIALRLNNGEDLVRRRIAKGIAPVAGRDGKLLLLVRSLAETGSADGSFTHRELKAFDNIEPGAVVGRVYHPQPGQPGRDVFGKVLEAPDGRKIELKTDETLAISHAGGEKVFDELVAKHEGVLVKAGDSLKVRSELTVAGDVTANHGELRFIGSIKVNGNVERGASIRAKRAVTVNGNVLGGKILSECDSVVVSGLIAGEENSALKLASTLNISSLTSGGGKGRDGREQVVAGGDISAKIAQFARLRAEGEIRISKEIHASWLRAGRALNLKDAEFISGEAYTPCGLEARVLGTAAGAKVVVHLCTEIESSAEYLELQLKCAQHEHGKELLELYLGPYADNPSLLSRLKPEHREKLEEMSQKLMRLNASHTLLLRQMQEMLDAAATGRELQVNVGRTLHAGVVLTAANCTFAPAEQIGGKCSVVFDPAANEFRKVAYQELPCVSMA